MSKPFYELQLTRDDGEPTTPQPYRYDYHKEVFSAIVLLCPRMDLRQCRHFIDLAMRAPNHPVDVVHWEDNRLLFSARLTYKKERPDQGMDQPHHGHSDEGGTGQ